MELVIKLDDETYKEIMERTEFDTLSLGIKLIEAVQNGRPLEEEFIQIKEEIFNKQNEFTNNLLSECNVRYGLNIAEIIIDKNIAELKGENK